MQVTIWQQFSSNHSARFTVVGVFGTPQEAQTAADELLALLKSIYDWYHQPENINALQRWETAWLDSPSPREMEIAEEYGVEWCFVTPDWLWIDELGHGPVQVVDNMVLVDGREGELGSHPADDLIQRLGGQALVDGSIGADPGGTPESVGEVLLFVTCLAPDEATAQSIVSEARPTLYSVGMHVDTRRTGKRLNFERVKFRNIGEGLAALVAYLRGRDCTEIEIMPAEYRAGEDE